MQKLIWYNPDVDTYESGSEADYITRKSMSSQKEDFTILFTFNATSEKMMTQLTQELNEGLT